MKKSIDITRLKRDCPLPELLRRLGLGRYAKSCCSSPFRSDQNPSWGIFQRSNRWMYKDLATGEAGDEIGVLAQVHKLDPEHDFLRLLKIYEGVARKKTASPTPEPTKATTPQETPDLSAFTEGTYNELERLSALRGISVSGLRFAQDRGVLMFGECFGFDVYGVKDSSNRLAEIRRLDGLVFPACGQVGERKSHTLKGSQKNWPLGILEAKDVPCMALVEGLPDFLALHQCIVDENAQERVGPVAMLSSACLINGEALPLFRGKHIRVYPHIDRAGIKAGQKWQKQLMEAGAEKVEFFDFSAFEDCRVKDLCDFNLMNGGGSNPMERNVLP